MGLSGLVVLTGKLIVYTAIVLLVIALIPGLPPHIKFDVLKFPEERKLEGPLARNKILDKAEVIVGNEVTAAESIAADGDTIYFGSSGGIIYKFDGKLKKVVQTGEPCDVVVDESKCGRPLGLRLDKDKNLWVADAYKGILKINPETGKKQVVVKLGQRIEGSPVTYPDDVDIGKNGTIYWSDASQLVPEEGTLEFLGGVPSGRLIQTNPKTGESKVLINKVAFANGVQLSPKQDFVLVCETSQQRVLRYYLEGIKAGQSDIFVDHLPGMPDNLRSNGKDGFYISLILPRDSNMEIIGKYPFLRKLLLRVDALVRRAILLAENCFPQNYYVGKFRKYVHELILSTGGNPAAPVIIVETDVNGKIIGSLQSDKSDIRMISQATVGDKYLYFGSPFLPKVYRLKRTDLKATSS